jgi:FKBP-type peptidyl-prolyl cis-trans isomerase
VQVGTGATVVSSSTLRVFYTGWLASNGTEFERSRTTGAPTTFALSGVIQGWQQGLPGMKVGGIRRLLIPAALAYGNNPPPGSGIPPGADLIFEVKLLGLS